MNVTIHPFYVATPQGQIRLWRVGAGPPCVVLPGLILGAQPVARRLAAAQPPLDALAVELPGLGGSAGILPDGLASVVQPIAAALRTMGLQRAPLLALDLCSPIATALHADLPGASPSILVHQAAALGWATHRLAPPPGTPQPDGTHLTALFAFLRDRHVMDAADPLRASATGEALPDAAALDETVVAAALRPGSFAALWQACATALTSTPGESGVAGWDDALRELRMAAPTHPHIPADRRDGLRFAYADTPQGRMHLRRAGPMGQRPVIALHSAPGSAAPLAGLVQALAADRDVIAPDYLGNGESDKPPGPVDIATLGRDMVALADSLGLDRFDLWGTHTGALIAIEAALAAPGRVGCAILEGPVLLPPSLNQDILARYFPRLEPDGWGLHLQQAWNMRRDMFLFWPWYRAERAAARPLGIPDPAFLHDWTIGLLQSGATYHRSYRAAFEYDTAARLPLLSCRSLVCAGPSDMLVGCLATARAMDLPRVTVEQTPATVWYPRQPPGSIAATVALYRHFLDAKQGHAA